MIKLSEAKLYEHLFAGEALERFIKIEDMQRVLDIGSGSGKHATVMRNLGYQVKTINLEPEADFVGDYLRFESYSKFDGIWASHVLEHQPNVGLFLKKCFYDLRDGGVLAVTVPPMKQELVGGHVSLFNAGTLLYNLVLAGFDCREARVSDCYVSGPLETPYNISVIVRKKRMELPKLRMDYGDLEVLSPFFPIEVEQGVDGRIGPVRWDKEV